MKKYIILTLLSTMFLTTLAQERKTVTLLPTLSEGAWPCCYYWLNYNNDIPVAEAAHWAALDEDESDWIEGVGPFSNSNDQFRTTDWASQTRPLLVRRHFTLSAQMLDAILHGTLTLTCSYDENPHVFLNGQRVWSAKGWNDNDYALFNLGRYRSLLREGDNVLAVSLQQGGGGGHIDYGLTATIVQQPDEVGQIRESCGANVRCYDLAGRSANANTRGIIIVNGKKIIRQP